MHNYKTVTIYSLTNVNIYIYIYIYIYNYTTATKLKITITRHQIILAAPGNNRKCKSN